MACVWTPEAMVFVSDVIENFYENSLVQPRFGGFENENYDAFTSNPAVIPC